VCSSDLLNGNPPPWLAKIMGLDPRQRVRFDAGNDNEEDWED
jgi:hypothetical protein